MKFRTVKAIREALLARGGYLEKILDSESPEYVPHLDQQDPGWTYGIWDRFELLDWANDNLTAGKEPDPSWSYR
jgi:hypothetical protein